MTRVLRRLLPRAENRSTPLPFFTMVACRSRPSLPFVQWNTFEDRDPDLAVWPPGSPRAPGSARHCRRGRGGSHWRVARLARRLLRRESRVEQQGRARARSRRTSGAHGALALLAQRCARGDSELLNVRIKLLKRAMRRFTQDFAACVAMANRTTARSRWRESQRCASSSTSKGTAGGQPARATSSAAPRPQAGMGVVEWFEPLLQPWVHYVPVSGDLDSLSDAVRWARVHDVRAQRMPPPPPRPSSARSHRARCWRRARLVAGTRGSTRAAASTAAAARCEPPPGYTIARFTCEVRGGGASTSSTRTRSPLLQAPEIAKMDAGRLTTSN